MPHSRSTKKSSPPKINPLIKPSVMIACALVLIATNLWIFNALNASDQPVYPDNEQVKEEVEEVAETEQPLWKPAVPDTRSNILLLGLDRQGFSDEIIIASYDIETFESAIISINRSTYVSDQTWAKQHSGQNHLAWASNQGMGGEGDYHAGARLASYTVEKLLGIPIHGYASIDHENFVKLVNLIGGVEIYVDLDFAAIKPTKSDNISNPLPTGLKSLNGEQAYFYARYRGGMQNYPRIPEPGSQDAVSDRVFRNQRLLKAILDQCLTLEADELIDIAEELKNKVNTSLEDWDIIELVNLLFNQSPQKVEMVVLPGEEQIIYQERINKDIAYFFLDFMECDKILQELGLK